MSMWPRWNWGLLYSAPFLICVVRAEEQTMNFKVFQQTEEESSSLAIPDNYRCHACHAAAHQLRTGFEELNVGPDGKPTEFDVIEAVEAACNQKTFGEKYRIRELDDGQRVIDGPGLPDWGAGVTQGGGRWGARIGAVCGRLPEDEDVMDGYDSIWDFYVAHKGTEPFRDALCKFDCGAESRKRKFRESRRLKEGKEKPKKKKTQKLASVAPLEGPEITVNLTKDNFEQYNKKHTFVMTLFYDKGTEWALKVFEKSARLAETSKELKQIRFACINRETEGELWSVRSYPAGLFFRRGYKNPKVYLGHLDEPQAWTHWIKLELPNYMKDDPDKFPRLPQTSKGKEDL